MLLVVNEKTSSNNKKQQGYWHINPYAQPNGLISFFRRTCGMIALHVILIHSEVVEIHEKTIQQNDPKTGGDKIEIECSKTHFIEIFCRRVYFWNSARHLANY